MTCRTWGQYNFETFDGLYYYFPGRCTYTLLKDCEETTQASIVVQVGADKINPPDFQPPASFRFHVCFPSGRKLVVKQDGIRKVQSQPKEKICSADW